MGYYQSSTKKYVFHVVVTNLGGLYQKLPTYQTRGISKEEYKGILDMSNDLINKLNKSLEGDKLIKVDLNETTKIVSYNATNHFLLTEGDSFDKDGERVIGNWSTWIL